MSNIARLAGDRIVLPGLASVHSHAFQRALRGKTHRLSAGEQGNFWRWREQMYVLASALGPEEMYALARLTYADLARNGVTAVGEFHYLHHGVDGQPHEDRLLMADALIRAARDVGLRITLLRSVYQRAGHGRAIEPTQRRFVDASIEDGLHDLESLAKRYAEDPCVRVGLAMHSVRAIERAAMRPLVEHARRQGWPIHMHVAEQPREIEECLAEHGMRPVELLAQEGVLGPDFTAVHATHILDNEIDLLAASRSRVALCRTTERDLGDGAPPLQVLLKKHVPICFGADSHAVSDPFEEMRAAELDERTRLQGRGVALDGSALIAATSTIGYAAIGFAERASEDRVSLDAEAACLAGLLTSSSIDELDNCVAFAASGPSVVAVDVAGRKVVTEGRVPNWDFIVRQARAATVRMTS